MPKVGEEPAEEDKLSTQLEPKIMVFWQGLYFAEERLDAQVLPWMKRARDAFNKKAQGEIADAFDRVVGFLFLDGSFRPDSHKTRLHMQDELVKELMEPPTSHRGSTRQVAIFVLLIVRFMHVQCRIVCFHLFENSCRVRDEDAHLRLLKLTWV